LIDVHDQGSLFTSLVPARAAGIALERARRKRDSSHGVGEWTAGDKVTKVVAGSLAFDARVGRVLRRRGVRLPGLSHWVFGTVR
jgi:hypothetical protein